MPLAPDPRPPGRGAACPGGIGTRAELVTALDALRRDAARGTGRRTISLDLIARRTGIPRSTVHTYVSGKVLPAADAFDAILHALGVPRGELRTWADALDQVAAAEREAGASPAQAAAAGPVAAATQAAPAGSTVPRELPRRITGFIGRDAELAALDQAWDRQRGTGPLLGITGPGGLGKTALAVEWASRHLDRYPDGQLYVDLRGYGPAEPSAPARVLRRLLASLGLEPRDHLDDEQLAARLRTVLAPLRAVLILDNARNAEHVHLLLPAAPGVTTIVTSRDDLAALRVTAGAERVTPAPLTDDEAARIVTGDDPGVAALRRACGGLPLALRILHERVDREGSAPASGALLDSFTLTGGDPAREGGVRAVIGWSYRALDPQVRHTFRCLGAAPTASATPQTLAALAGLAPEAAQEHAQRLAEASLLTAGPGDRLTWHDLVGATAQELLDAEGGEQAEARERLLGHYDRLTSAIVSASGTRYRVLAPGTAGVDLGGQDLAALVAAEEEPILLTAATALETRGDQVAWRLVENLLLLQARFTLAIDPLGVLERATGQAATAGDLAYEAALRFRLGLLRAMRGDYAEAERNMMRSHQIAEETGNRAALLVNLANLGQVYVRTARFDEGVALQERIVSVAAAAGNRFVQTLAQMNIGGAHLARGRYAEAEEAYTAARDLNPDDPAVQAEQRIHLALVAIERGEAGVARARLEGITPEQVTARPLAGSHLAIARAALAVLDAEDGALALAEEAVATARTGGDEELELRAVILAAEARTISGRPREALERLGTVIGVAEAHSQITTALDGRIARARALIALREPAAARDEAERVLARATALGLDPHERRAAELLMLLG